MVKVLNMGTGQIGSFLERTGVKRHVASSNPPLNYRIIYKGVFF